MKVSSINDHTKKEVAAIAKAAKKRMDKAVDPGLRHKFKILYEEFSKLEKEI